MTRFALGLAVVLAAAPATAANAATFTFDVKNEAPATVGGLSPEGAAYGGASWKGTSNAVFADGRKTTSTSTCVSMSQPPRDAIFMMHGACDVTANDGTFSVIMGCNFLDKAATQTGCVGSLIGKSGAYASKRGAITLHGKGAAATGTGQWYE